MIMIPVSHFMIILHLLLSSNALSWPRQRHAQPLLRPSKSTVDVNLDFLVGDSSGLATSEVESLFLRKKYDDLDAFSHKPDCFRHAASLLRTRCAELDMGEDARVEAAIRMTLCELATAHHHSPPLECAPFSFSLKSPLSDNIAGYQGNCVEALSRSAQFWSSYSGYLREVPQLCYAFRRWNDIDTAKDIYRNATLEKLALIRFILQREENGLHFLRTSEVHLKEMRNLADQMRVSNGVVSLASNEMVKQLTHEFQDTFDLVKDTITGIQRREEQDRSRFLSQMDAALEHVMHRHSIALMALLPTFSTVLESNLEDLFTLVHKRSVAVLDLLNDVDQSWSSLSTHFSTLHHTMSHLIQASTNANDLISVQLIAVESAHSLQEKTNHAASELAETLRQLGSVAHTEIEWINRTGSESRDRIIKWEVERQQQRYIWESWGWDAIRWIGEVVWRMDPSSIEQTFRLPVFRLALLFAGILRFIFVSAFSSLMSVFVVVVSFKKYLSKAAQSSPPVIPSTTTPHLALTSYGRNHYSCKMPKPQARGMAAPSYYYYPSTKHRLSRIPDRLCKPITSAC